MFSSLVKITYEKTSLKTLSTNRKSPERGRIFISYRIINALKKEQVIEGPPSASVARPSSSCQGAEPREVRCGLPTGMCVPPHIPRSQAQPTARAAPGWPPVRKAGILGTHKRKKNDCLLDFLLCSASLNIRCRIFLSGQKSPLMPSFQRKSPRPRRPVHLSRKSPRSFLCGHHCPQAALHKISNAFFPLQTSGISRRRPHKNSSPSVCQPLCWAFPRWVPAAAGATRTFYDNCPRGLLFRAQPPARSISAARAGASSRSS